MVERDSRGRFTSSGGTSVGTLVVHTQVDTSGVVKGFNVMKGEIKAVTSQIGLISNSVKSTFSSLMSLKNIIVGSFAIGAIKSAVNAYAQAEAAQQGLASALRATNQNVASLMPNFQKLQVEIQRLTVYEDDAVASAQKLAINMGVSGTAIEDVTKAAVALGQYYGDDLNAATQAVVRATQGQWRELGRLFPEIKNANSESERMAILNRKIAEGMQQAQERVKTTSGAFKQFQNVMGDVWEEVGKGFIDGIAAIDGFKDESRGLVSFLASDEFKGQISTIFKDIAIVIGTVVTAIFDLSKTFLGLANDIAGKYGVFAGLGIIFYAVNKKAAILAGTLLGLAAAWNELKAVGNYASANMHQQELTELNATYLANRRKINDLRNNPNTSYQQAVSMAGLEETQRKIEARIQALGGIRNGEYAGAENAARRVEGMANALNELAGASNDISDALARANAAAAGNRSLTANPLRQGARAGEDNGSNRANDDAARKLKEWQEALYKATHSEYEYEIYMLDQRREEYQKTCTDELQIAQWYNAEKAKLDAKYAEARAKIYQDMSDRIAAIDSEMAISRAGSKQDQEIAQAHADAEKEINDYRDKLNALSENGVSGWNEDTLNKFEEMRTRREALLTDQLLEINKRYAATNQDVLDRAFLAGISDRRAKEIAEIELKYKRDIDSFEGNASLKEQRAAANEKAMREEIAQVNDKYDKEADDKLIAALEKRKDITIAAKLEELRRLRELTPEGSSSRAAYDEAITGMSENLPVTISQRYSEMLNIVKEKYGQLGEYMSETTESITSGLSGALSDFATGAKSWKESLDGMWQSIGESFSKMVSDMIAQWAMLKLQTAFLGSDSKDGSGSAGMLKGAWDWTKSLFGFAKGGIFNVGRLMPFGNGGLVTMPTVFPMANGAGVMGEAGAEAIMPLKRMSGGALGVQAQIGGVSQAAAPNINIHVYAADSESIVSMMARNPAAIIGPLQQYLQRGGQLPGLAGV